MAASTSNVWTQMNYIPPRGQCNHKPSLLAARCPCLRFMLHPLKVSIAADLRLRLRRRWILHLLTQMQSSSSYECDGCGHHASFHSMENKAEDEIRKRWETEEKERAERSDEARQRPKKRMRAIEYNRDDDDTELNRAISELMQGAKPKPKASVTTRKKPAKVAGARAKQKASEITDDDTVVELD